MSRMLGFWLIVWRCDELLIWSMAMNTEEK